MAKNLSAKILNACILLDLQVFIAESPFKHELLEEFGKALSNPWLIDASSSDLLLLCNQPLIIIITVP